MQTTTQQSSGEGGLVFHNVSGGVPSPIGHYCHAVELPNGIVALSGIKAWKPGAGTQIEGDVQAQARLIFQHIDTLLDALRLARTDIYRISCHLGGVDDYEAFNRCYSEWLGTHKPARTVLAGYSLRGGAKVELVVEAYRAAGAKEAAGGRMGHVA